VRKLEKIGTHYHRAKLLGIERSEVAKGGQAKKTFCKLCRGREKKNKGEKKRLKEESSSVYKWRTFFAGC